MTEQSKIPVPPVEEETLLERAVRTFGTEQFAPPPVPHNLAPRPVKPAQRNRPAAEPVAAPPAVSDLPEPQPQVRAEPVPEVPAPATARPVEEPVPFPAASHPVNRTLLRDLGMIVPEGGVTALLEEFRIVKRTLLLQASHLRQQGGGAAAQRVLICSPHPGEGKTFCAVNLAMAIAAEKEGDVVLVDADFAKPSVLATLGLPGGKGLMDALADPTIDVADCVLGTDVPGLWVLPAGGATASDTEYLSTSRAGQVLDRLTQGAPNRIVIFDSPPALAASPAAELAKYVGQALIVVRADRTGHGALEDAISLLSGCPNIQLLLNATHFSPSGRSFGTYYGYKG